MSTPLESLRKMAKTWTSVGRDRAQVREQLLRLTTEQADVELVLDEYFPTNGHSTLPDRDAFQALKQPPAKTVPVESLVPPIDDHPAMDEVADATQAVIDEDDDDDLLTENPLTEQDAIQLVKQWAEEDGALSASDRESEEEILERLKDGPCAVSDSKLKEIVSMYWSAQASPNTSHPYPPELTSLVKSGVVRRDEFSWVINRCTACGQFNKDKCCGSRSVLPVPVVRFDGQSLTRYGRQAAGLDPIPPPVSQEQILQNKITSVQNEPCWNQFRGVGELKGDGTVKMYIENFLTEGVTLICGLAKEGKSFMALSVAKALTTGKPLFGRRGFEVPEIVPVLYLAAESGDGGLKVRCKKFGITEDKTKFICRTLTQGLMFGLDDSNIEAIVKAMRPVVVLETLIRFNNGKDEDDASESKKLAEGIFRLIALGARAVVAIHHSRKDVKTNPTKEAAARGSGDVLAMADAVWLLMQDEKLFQGGKGPNELDIIGWGRDFSPVPMRLALTKKAPKDLPPRTITYAPGIVSYIDCTGDFGWIDKLQIQSRRRELSEVIEQLVTETPSITKPELAEKTGASEWEVRGALKRLGYERPAGGKKGATTWVKRKKPNLR